MHPRVIGNIVVIKIHERNYNCINIRLSTIEPRQNVDDCDVLTKHGQYSGDGVEVDVGGGGGGGAVTLL